MKKFFPCIALLATTLSIAGCGGGLNDADPTLVPVTGTVTVGGSPLSGGTINLSQNKKSYSGKIADDGTYEVKASPSAPGAPPGNYKVSISSWSSMPTMDDEGNPVEGKSAVDEKYSSPETSGLTVDVTDGGGPYDFDLK